MAIHMKWLVKVLAVSLLLVFSAVTIYGEPRIIDPAQAVDLPDFKVQGEYAAVGYGAQVIAMGNGEFRCYLLSGGLPGCGWDGEQRLQMNSVATDEVGTVLLRAADGTQAVISDEMMMVKDVEGRQIAKLLRTTRRSATLGLAPPPDAVVLFDGTSAEGWHNGRMSDDGLLKQGVTSKQQFGDHFVHVEFLLPFEPTRRGQGRGNSGIYVQGSYEVQMLDSFGLEGRHDECGGIYSIRAPDVNMCLPPLAWQTFDIHFTAARFDEEGRKTDNAKMTVYHNGVLVHEEVEVPNPTTAAPIRNETGRGPVYLQHHGSEVRYRNIWIVER